MSRHEITVEMQMQEAVKTLYEDGGLLFQREVTSHPLLGLALQGGSKSGSRAGYGIPEAAIFSDDSCQTPLALIECKKEGRGELEKARAEAEAYVRYVNESGVRVPLAIAYAGVGQFSLSLFVGGEFLPCQKANGEPFSDFPQWNELQALAASSDGVLRAAGPLIDERKLGKFFVHVNEVFRRSNIAEPLTRVMLFTAFLVGCKAEDFRDTVASVASATSSKKTAAGLADALTSAVRDLLKKDADRHGTERDFQKDLDQFYDIIRSELEITNNRAALESVIRECIPQFCVKEKFSVHDFLSGLDESAFKIVDVYEVFHTYSPSNDLGQYFTPRQMVRAMIRVIEQLRGHPLSIRDIAYDPACGVGGFLVGVLERVGESKFGAERDAVKLAMGRNLLGCEPAAKVAHIARVNLWMHGDGTSGIYQGEANKGSLERLYTAAYASAPTKSKPGEVGLDTDLDSAMGRKQHPLAAVLARNCHGRQPTIAMLNPPFPEDKKAYQSFEFVEHALRSLEEGGWLAAIVPPAPIISDDKANSAFRERVLRHAQLEAVFSLPVDLFQPGASVNTYVMVLRKSSSGHQLKNPVLFARCPTDGFEMSKAAKRRLAPSGAEEKAVRNWDEELAVGGEVAELLNVWIPAHQAGHVRIGQLTISKKLTEVDKTSGADWAPERFIEANWDETEILRLANRISAELQAFEIMREVGGQW